MKFGPVPLGEGAGAILAHSIGLASGRLRKGQVLTPDHLTRLAAEGHTEITVARLEPGDVPEADAAQRLAEALVGPDPNGLRLTPPTNGRVNIVATSPGVVQLDAGRLAEVNRVDPMISLATVPELHQIAPKGLVATVKVISYAVPGARLAKAEAVGAGAISLAKPQLKTAALIVTEVPGGPGLKGTDAIAARLEALDMTQGSPLTVPHRTDALTAALTDVQVQGAVDLILVLTGSATSDAHDVAPSALRAAGGTVTRFGMPVDPGNLLFCGTLGPVPVIGLPGCARSPALNGADWVLARTICGVPVTSDDIAAMGVGGLLKEIPTRPAPRRAHEA
ncbi:molybdopterin-binding protein [Pseudaestuariivita sp.]|uniref:molybdopterin-binding protein n=1 Tax=Pseudaestuariivita sp. TaxID=2211669 RepID=UPI0040596F6F